MYGVIIDNSFKVATVPLIFVMFVDFLNRTTEIREITKCGLSVEDVLARIKCKVS